MLYFCIMTMGKVKWHSNVNTLASPPPPSFRLHNSSLIWGWSGGGTACEPIPLPKHYTPTSPGRSRSMNVGLLFLVYTNILFSLSPHPHRQVMTLKSSQKGDPRGCHPNPLLRLNQSLRQRHQSRQQPSPKK